MTTSVWRGRASSRNFWLLVGAGLLVLSAQLAIGISVFFPSLIQRAGFEPLPAAVPLAPPPLPAAEAEAVRPTTTSPGQLSRSAPRRVRYVCVASEAACRCTTVHGVPVQVVLEAMCREIALHGDLQVLPR